MYYELVLNTDTDHGNTSSVIWKSSAVAWSIVLSEKPLLATSHI